MIQTIKSDQYLPLQLLFTETEIQKTKTRQGSPIGQGKH